MPRKDIPLTNPKRMPLRVSTTSMPLPPSSTYKVRGIKKPRIVVENPVKRAVRTAKKVIKRKSRLELL